MSTTAKRLIALEQSAQQARAARIAAQEDLICRAARLMPSQALEDILEWTEEARRDLENVMRVIGTGAEIARPLEHPARERVCAWMDAFEATPKDGIPPSPPMGTAEYLEREALDWERALTEEASGTEDLRTAARWSAARLWFFVAVARVMGEKP